MSVGVGRIYPGTSQHVARREIVLQQGGTQGRRQAGLFRQATASKPEAKLHSRMQALVWASTSCWQVQSNSGLNTMSFIRDGEKMPGSLSKPARQPLSTDWPEASKARSKAVARCSIRIFPVLYPEQHFEERQEILLNRALCCLSCAINSSAAPLPRPGHSSLARNVSAIPALFGVWWRRKTCDSMRSHSSEHTSLCLPLRRSCKKLHPLHLLRLLPLLISFVHLFFCPCLVLCWCAHKWAPERTVCKKQVSTHQ